MCWVLAILWFLVVLGFIVSTLWCPLHGVSIAIACYTPQEMMISQWMNFMDFGVSYFLTSHKAITSPFWPLTCSSRKFQSRLLLWILGNGTWMSSELLCAQQCCLGLSIHWENWQYSFGDSLLTVCSYPLLARLCFQFLGCGGRERERERERKKKQCRPWATNHQEGMCSSLQL